MTLIGSVVERTPNVTDSTTSVTPFPVSADPKTGFPAVAHRSQRQRKSAFRQNMEAARPMTRDAVIPVVQTTSGVADTMLWGPNETGWRSTMEAENAHRVARMTPQEREEELRLLRSKFGDISELAAILRRARDLKPKTDNKSSTPTSEKSSDEDDADAPALQSSSPPPVHNPHHRIASPPRPVLSRRSSVTGSSRPVASAPGTPGAPGVRFAEVTSRDVFTYPSAPTSPKRAALMIEAPPAEVGEGVPKVQWRGKVPVTTEPPKAVQSESRQDAAEASPSTTEPQSKKQEPAHPLSQVVSSSAGSTPPELKVTTDLPVAGAFLGKIGPGANAPAPGISFPTLSPINDFATPDAIRRQYFPNEPQKNPSLEWIADLPEIPDTPVTSEYAYIDGMGEKTRFNLAGTPIPQDLAKEMPVHDGLHHNSRTSAGYTLGELLHLARSTAPMQRAMALDALARLTARVGRRELGAWFPRAYHPGNQDLSNRKQGENKIVLSAAELRKLVIESAVSALVERGAVGTRAVDCLYAALVVWDHQLARVDDVELTLRGVDIEGSNLHIMPSNYTVPDSGVSREIGLDEMKVVDSLDLDTILGTITRQLGARSLPISVLKRLLEIVVRLARQSQAHASSIVATPGLIPEIMRLFVLSGSLHPDSSGMYQPDALAIRLLIILARSSRQNASTLLDPTDSLLRFVAVLPPIDVAPTLLVATLDLYAVLGRYGMYAHIATVAADSFDALSRYVRTRQDPKLTRSWIRLRAIWITCATDPHSTTPPHEILWSQVEGWGWGEDTIAWARDQTIDAGLLAEVWNALSSYLGGAIVNGVRGGAAERDQVTQALKVEFENGKARNFINLAVSRLGNWVSKDESIVTEAEMYIDDTWLLYSALRLDNMLLPPPASDAASTSSPLNLPLESIAQLMNKVALNPRWLSAYSQPTTSPYSYAYLTNLALCLGYYLLLVRQVRHLEGMGWLKLAFITLHLLNPSCADIAARLLQGIGAAAIDEPSLNHLAEHLKPAAWDALLPFLLHELQPSAETIVSPPNVSTASISHVATQSLPSRPVLIGKSYGLPARNDWTMNPLDHLLRSGTSPVFKALPKEWDSDEVDVVRTTLALTSARQKALRDSPFHMTSEEIVFGCMRVFMLEHGQPHDDSSSEIFRDSHIERIMGSLLSEISLGSNRRDGTINKSPLETIAGHRLSGQPFYQFYTDLVGLYDAISFAHPLFSRVLLPPLSVNYETDYRRLFWGDYGHILRSIQTELADVPSNTLDEWLWPRDKDGEMIGWYLKGLMKGGVQGFLRFIAVHHVATSIWPDFHNAEGEGATEMSSKDKDRTRMIIGAMVHQAGPALLSAVMLYEQRRKDPILYPACYEGRGLDREHRSRRLEWAVTLCGDRVRGRLEHTYNV